MSQIVHLQHDDDDVLAYIERAAAIVGKAELADDLKVPAFNKAVDLLAGLHLVVQPTSPLLGQPHAPLLG